MITKIYKTDDGRVFNTEADAIAYEKELNDKHKKADEIEKEIEELKKVLEEKLDVASKTYNEYSKAYSNYTKAYEKHYGKKPELLSECLQEIVDLLF